MNEESTDGDPKCRLHSKPSGTCSSTSCEGFRVILESQEGCHAQMLVKNGNRRHGLTDGREGKEDVWLEEPYF